MASSTDDREATRRRKAVKGGTVAERRAYATARRRESEVRDAARVRLVDELGEGLAIPREQGFLSVPPPKLADVTAPVLEHANGLIDSIGPATLLEGETKGGFVARGFLPESAFELGSPYMRLALDERVVGPIAVYLGVVPVLAELDVWYSAHSPKAPKSSQLWHLDHADTTQIKLWVHLSDVDARSGPLTVLDAAASDRLAEAAAYNFSESYRLPDDRVEELLGSEGLMRFEGPRGTVDFVDTSRCFHFGSRVSADGEPRRMVMIQYLTPYSFGFADHRQQAPFRGLASAGTTELDRLLLGAG